jgi:hypothetical protein
MLNGRIGVHFERSGLGVDAFGRNLLNQVYPSYETDVSTSIGIVAAIAAPPREWGIEVSKKFYRVEALMNTVFDFKGKSVLLCGSGGGGVGTATALMLAQAGAFGIGVDRSDELADDIRDRLAGYQGGFLGITADPCVARNLQGFA